jgi:molybdenum cofactor cytidylyltransferase
MGEPTAPAALVLAAGASDRFGGDPKALLRVGTEPAVVRLVRIAREAGHDPVAVVTGPHGNAIAAALDPETRESVRLLSNERWEDGRTGSVQFGLRSLGDVRETLVWPVDHPFVEPETVGVLRDVARRDAIGVWFVPTYDGHGGHPVLVRSAAFAAVFDLRPDEPLRAVLPKLGPQVSRVPVEDFGVTANVNTPEEYVRGHARWLERHGGA